jgi:hypothetical protein
MLLLWHANFEFPRRGCVLDGMDVHQNRTCLVMYHEVMRPKKREEKHV